MRLRLLFSALVTACGTGQPAPATHLRLWADATAELTEAPPASATRTVFASRFETDMEGWREITTPGREAGGFTARLENEAGRGVLRLAGVHGGLLAVVPVEPDTCYVFSGEVRADELETEASPFDGARFWMGEATEDAPFEKLRTTNREHMVAKWSSPSALGHDGWQAVRRVFVTTPHTRFLHFACSLAARHDVRSGSARFADVRLVAVPLETYWRTQLEGATAARSNIEAPVSAWQRARAVTAELGGEHRPALVLLPGDRLRFALPPLGAGARLSFGAGPWPPTLLAERGGRATLRVRSLDKQLLAQPFDLPEQPADARWEERELALAEGASELEFSLGGDAPLVLGAPSVRTQAPSSTAPNLLLISIDTLRADRVGAYTAGLDTTPNLDRLARAGVLCRDASAPSPYTLPSHATLLTGQLPSVHGVVENDRRLSATRSTSLAEVLGRAGYRTRAFTSGGYVNAAFGLDRGFEGFSQVDPVREPDSHFYRRLVEKHGPTGAARLLEEQGHAGVERWLRARGREPFFLFLHTYAVHDYDVPQRYLRCAELGCARPSAPPRTRTPEEAAAYTAEMRAHIQHVYDAALRYTDERLGKLFALLEELGLAANTLIVVTSDHGEEFFEHGALQHGRTLYEELLGIPLILAGPGIAPREIARPAMLVDVVPTVLARLGLPRPEHLQGVDLLGPDWPARAIWSEVDDRFAHKYALREEQGRKVIHGPPTSGLQFPNEREWEHYDLTRDPREERPLTSPEEQALEDARRELVRFRAALEELGASLGAIGRGELGNGTLAELDELGYGGE